LMMTKSILSMIFRHKSLKFVGVLIMSRTSLMLIKEVKLLIMLRMKRSSLNFYSLFPSLNLNKLLPEVKNLKEKLSDKKV
jgi:pyruvate/2-oxoglutarate dehydrogenase complex dihydrolipoamide dehydrogenase (E3) component